MWDFKALYPSFSSSVSYILANFSLLGTSLTPPGWFFVASSCAIMTNLLPDASASNLKLVSFSCRWPSLPLRQKNKTTWNHTLRRRASGLLSAMAGEVFNFIKSSLSMAGLWVTFSSLWRFKRTIWAFYISFDLLNRGSELSLNPLLRGDAFRYLSKECRKPRREDLL